MQRADGGSYEVGSSQQGTPGRRYLLTGGLAVCGECEAPLVGSMKQLRNAKGVRSKPYLLCHPKSQGPKGKGKACLGVMLPEVEEYVLAELWARLDSPEFLEALAGDDDHEEERARLVTVLEGIDGQRRELAGMWGRRELTTAEWQAAKAEVDEAERQANADLAVIPPSSSTLADIDGARENWDDGTLDEQRAFIRRHVSKVTIHRATRHGRPGLDTDRVGIEFVPR